MAGFRGEKFDEVAADPVVGLIAQRSRRGRIDGTQPAGQVVGANEAETALDQLLVAPLTLGERVLRFLPGRRNLVDHAGRGRVTVRRVFLVVTPVFVRHTPPDAPRPWSD